MKSAVFQSFPYSKCSFDQFWGKGGLHPHWWPTLWLLLNKSGYPSVIRPHTNTNCVGHLATNSISQRGEPSASIFTCLLLEIWKAMHPPGRKWLQLHLCMEIVMSKFELCTRRDAGWVESSQRVQNDNIFQTLPLQQIQLGGHMACTSPYVVSASQGVRTPLLGMWAVTLWLCTDPPPLLLIKLSHCHNYYLPLPNIYWAQLSRLWPHLLCPEDILGKPATLQTLYWRLIKIRHLMDLLF